MEIQQSQRASQRLAWGLVEAAEACGVSVTYLRKIISKGELRPTRAGRRVLISDAELRQWIARNSEQVAA